MVHLIGGDVKLQKNSPFAKAGFSCNHNINNINISGSNVGVFKNAIKEPSVE
jgi:hypothetical protein